IPRHGRRALRPRVKCGVQQPHRRDPHLRVWRLRPGAAPASLARIDRTVWRWRRQPKARMQSMVKSSRTKSRRFTVGRRAFERGSKANRRPHEMGLIYLDFKHFHAANTEEFRQSCKVSSIISAKVLSIMPIEARPVTAD